MTEQEWLASDDPDKLHDWLSHDILTWPSHRKLRLYAVAICRQVWHHLTDERSKRAVVVAERLADLPPERAARVSRHVSRAYGRADAAYVAIVDGGATHESPARTMALAARDALQPTGPRIAEHLSWRATMAGLSLRVQADLFREIVGNPFRHPELQWEGRKEGRCLVQVSRGAGWVETVGVPWLTPTVVALAQATYGDRDWERLPILADALEEAGCTEEVLLRHLRRTKRCQHYSLEMARGCPECGGLESRHNPETQTPIVHVRGCWALDLVLGKE